MINPGIKDGLQHEKIYIKIFWKEKINLLFKNTVKISPEFAKFLREIIIWPKSKLSALSPPSVYVSSLGVNLDNKQLYMAKSPYAEIQLNRKLCKTFINTGAEINVMTKEAKNWYNLLIRIDPNLQLISYTGHYQDFIVVCKDVKINIGEIITKQNIFVMDSTDHVLVLEILFMIKNWARID